MSSNLGDTAMFALGMALSGESNPSQYLTKGAQDKAVASHKLAKKMSPSREAFEELGFVFTDTKSRLLVDAQLPEGWSIVKTSNYYFSDIIDDNGNKRGKFFYDGNPFDADAHMELVTRYRPCCNYSESNGGRDCRYEFYFGNEREELFVAGAVEYKRNNTEEENHEAYVKEGEYRKAVEQWGDENYPDWRNIDAYWDRPARLTQKKPEN